MRRILTLDRYSQLHAKMSRLENRIVNYQIGQQVWKREGRTNNEAREGIDYVRGLRTWDRLKSDARRSSETLATEQLSPGW